ncbi:MAG: apolipoprotein N-acyltransferase [Gammaproteobacteria bacterium]|nr:MAG: apolipoprotein N-acyltransferase [Gammaproteobacteria bacterium]
MSIFTKQGWQGHFIALLAGALLPLSFSPFHFYPVAVLSLTLLFLSWQAVSAKQAAIRGFLYGLGMYGVGVSWIYVAIHDFGNASILLAALLTGLFVAFLALYLAVLGWGLKKLSDKFSDFDFVLLIPVSWVLFEWFKGWFLTGFPWLDVGVGQIDGALSGYTPIIGALGVSLLVAFSAGLLATSLQSKRWWPVLLMVVIWIGGQSLKSVSWTDVSGNEIKVSLIQGNIPQEIKWNKEQLMKTLALYQTRTELHWDSDLIVWPENAVPVFHHQAREFYLDPLAELARKNKTDILLGLPVMERSSRHYFNSMMSLGSTEGFYHKKHLVPFGDYMPLEWLRGLIEFFDLPMSAFRPGSQSQELLQVAGQKVAISVCYEDAFSTEVLVGVPEATLLVNATNNAWYGDSFAPHQHLQISQNRALETGRPVLRVTTNGISALIGYQGDLEAKTAQFEQAVLTGDIQPRQGATPYVRWGQWPLLLLSLFMLMMWAYYRRID